MRTAAVALLAALLGPLTAAGCYSTRQLAAQPTDALHTPNHARGWVVPTTEPWRERIDPLTTLQFQRADGQWSEPVHATDLHVDQEGAWIDDRRALGLVAEAIRVEDVSPAVAAIIADHRPPAGSVQALDADVAPPTRRLVLTADHADLEKWIEDVELDVARAEPSDHVDVERWTGARTETVTLTGDAAKFHQLRAEHGAPLGRWSLYAATRGWYADLRGDALLAALDAGLAARLGWRWAEIARIEVTNLSGGKTFGGLIGSVAAAIALAPLALLAHGGLPSSTGSGARAASGTLDIAGHVAANAGTSAAAHDAGWLPSLTPTTSLQAAPLFTRGARYRAYLQPTLALDTTTTYRGDLVDAGAIARLRVGQIWEIGGGVREVGGRSAGAWARSTTGVFATGLHLPLDAAMAFALPIGVEVAGGGQVALDVRVPWGLRYTRGHTFVTALPATPEYVHLHDAPRRWTLASSLEVGYAF